MIYQVHIPKTGGTALATAIGPFGVRRPGHDLKLSGVPKEDTAITIVRDPLERFVSAFWHVATRKLFPWNSPNALALKMPDFEMSSLVFRPQVTWLDSNHDLLWVGNTATLGHDFLRLKRLLGLPEDVHLAPRPPKREVRLSSRAITNLRSFYAADYQLLEEGG